MKNIFKLYSEILVWIEHFLSVVPGNLGIYSRSLWFRNRWTLKQNISITGQVLGSLGRVIQIHKLEDLSYNYSEEDGIYYKEKGSNKEEIDFKTYTINTFMDEYLSIQ